MAQFLKIEYIHIYIYISTCFNSIFPFITTFLTFPFFHINSVTSPSFCYHSHIRSQVSSGLYISSSKLLIKKSHGASPQLHFLAYSLSLNTPACISAFSLPCTHTYVNSPYPSSLLVPWAGI